MNDLPRRVPGAHLRSLTEPPPDGWFGTTIMWPADDLDIPATTSVFEHYLGGNQSSGGPAAEALVDRVLEGLHYLLPGTRQ